MPSSSQPGSPAPEHSTSRSTGLAGTGPAAPTPPVPYQFSLFTLMQIMLVLAVLGAVGGRMRSALTVDKPGRVTFVFFTLLAPMLLLVVLVTGRQIWRLWQSPRRSGATRVGFDESERSGIRS